MKHNVLDIHRLIVDPKHFREGIGKALLAYIESEYKPRKIEVRTESKNYPDINFYLKHGFKEVEVKYVREGFFLTHFNKDII